MSNDDPTPELYRFMDRAGLDTPTLMDTKRHTARIVVDIRTKLAKDLKQFIERRDERKFKAGVASTVPKKIEVTDE